MIGLKITDLTTKSTKITKESQRLNKFLITGKTFCAGFVPFVSFVVYIVANRFDRIEDNGF